MQWDVVVPPNDIPSLIATKNPDFQLVPSRRRPTRTSSSTPSRRTTTRRWATCRSGRPSRMPSTGGQLVQDAGGSAVAPPLTHLIAPGTRVVARLRRHYPYNPTKAKQMLAPAGYPHLTSESGCTGPAERHRGQGLRDRCRPSWPRSASPSRAGGLGQRLLREVPDPGHRRQERRVGSGRSRLGPGLVPDRRKSYFLPILDGRNLPPNSSNFGFFNDPKLNTLDRPGPGRPSDSAATSLTGTRPTWRPCPRRRSCPSTTRTRPTIHGSQVHNCVYIGPIQELRPGQRLAELAEQRDGST